MNIFYENPMFSIAMCMTLFGYLAFHRLAVHREKMSQFSAAALEFTSIFTSELSELYPVCPTWPDHAGEYLSSKFLVLQSAVVAFKPHVKDKKGFETAWNIYRLGEDGREIDKQVYHQYMGFQINDKPRIDPETKLRENIDRLLSFAKA